MPSASRFASTFALAAAAAAVAAAPAANAADVSAKPSFTYQVHGQTMTYKVSLDGTTHLAANGAPAMPLNLSVDFGDHDGAPGGQGTEWSCTSKGSAPLHAWGKDSHTYAKPGTYTVTVRSAYCNDAAASAVAKGHDVPQHVTRYTVVVPASVATRPSAPAPATHPAGPEVETDNVADHTASSLSLAGAALLTSVGSCSCSCSCQ